MPVIVFHGSADTRVNAVNANQVIAQWSTTNACLSATNGETGFALSEQAIAAEATDGHAYQRHIYVDQSGSLLMEKWMVQGLGHAWPGSPNVHRYGDPKGPNASSEIWRFFVESASICSARS
jgi:poly(3-hydroxybutyrate) depolymerase